MHRPLFAALALATAAPAFAQDAPADEPTTENTPAVEAPATEEAPTEEAPAEEWLPTQFSAGEEVSFEAPRNDVFGMGEEVSVEAQVGDNALLMGRELHVEAPIQGDLFGMGETVRISSLVMGDVYAMAGNVIVDDGAVVNGNIYAMAGEVEIIGDVGHDLQVGAGRVRVEGAVGGNVDLAVGELTLGDEATIAGNLSYEAPQEASDVADKVEGEVTFTLAEDDGEFDIDVDDWDPEPEPQMGLFAQAAWWSTWRVFAYLTTALLGLVVFWLGGGTASQVGRTLRENPGQSLGVGFAALMLIPPVALMCAVTVVPGLVGVAAMLVWTTLLLLARIFVAHTLGDLILKQLRPDAVGNPMVSMAVGLIPMVFLFGLPWLGWLAHLTVGALGMGAALYAAWTLARTPVE